MKLIWSSILERCIIYSGTTEEWFGGITILEYE